MQHAELKRTVLPREIGKILDIAPIDQVTHSEWLVLAESGSLFRFDAEHLAWTQVISSVLMPEPDHEPRDNKHTRHHLHVSACGQFGAVVNDYGKRGQLLDLSRGVVTRVLDGGDYLLDTVPFSFAFVNVKGRALAVHRTDWNRLDITDPKTGELLTERGPTHYKQGESCPPHYLDYFHGALHISPKETYILSDGWVWHPVGVPTIWKLDSWCCSNVWESEDGPSKLDICARTYYWNGAICWIDENRLAIGGIGDDDEEMIDGARIFDVSLPGKASPGWREDSRWPLEIAAFQGPTGMFFSDGISLFSSGGDGLSRWDIGRGVKTGHLTEFNPTRYHRGTQELVQLVDDTLLRWAISA